MTGVATDVTSVPCDAPQVDALEVQTERLVLLGGARSLEEGAPVDDHPDVGHAPVLKLAPHLFELADDEVERLAVGVRVLLCAPVAAMRESTRGKLWLWTRAAVASARSGGRAFERCFAHCDTVTTGSAP